MLAEMTSPRKIERVFLLFPPMRLARETMKRTLAPLGLSYLAAVIRDEVEVQIMDAAAESSYEKELDPVFTWYGSPLSEIRARIEQFRPDLVGISCIFSSIFPVIREVCREVKKIDPGIITMVGGTYPTFMAAECLKEPSLDLIALGEGEMTLRSVIRRLREGRALSEIDGLASKQDGPAVITPQTQWIEDLDSIPFPARDLLPMKLYPRVGVPHSLSTISPYHAPMISSRGCPSRCIFCSSTRFWGNHYRARSADNVLDEIGELINRWGIDEIQFEDDNMTADRKRAKAIFRGMIRRGYQIKFNYPNGVGLWTLDEELVDLMKEAGCYEMTLAYESGCQEVLRRIVKKPLNLEQARKMTRYVQSKKIRTDAFYIIGFPGETREQMQETFRFAREMKTDLANFFIANPLPGTEMYELAKSRGMLRQDFNFENLTYSRSPYHEGIFPAGELERMAGREFLKYSLRSFLRNPRVLLKKFFVDLLWQRPAYTLGILVRIWRRNAPSQTLRDEPSPRN